MKKKLSKKILVLSFFLLPILTYQIFSFAFQFFIDSGAKKLIKLENSNRLSRTYGYVWQEINANLEMKQTAQNIINRYDSTTYNTKRFLNTKTIDFPSLSAVRILNSIKSFEKTITINDRNRIPLAELKTTHNCINLSELNKYLLQSLLTTEDKDFYTRKKAYDFNSILRATIQAFFNSVRTLKLQYPRGSSTIHMQVARFLLLKYDKRGYAYAEKSIERKLNELKLAQALKMIYSNEEILTLYINHCVSAGRGMIGYHDISKGLFGLPPDSINIPQSLYLARLVKWNRQIPDKIIQHVKICLPVLADNFNWDSTKSAIIEKQLDSLTFEQPSPVIAENSYLLDLANEYWKSICKKNGMSSSEINEIDISNPQSNIRRYGNLSIDLTVDYRLQKFLEKIVAKRGFGPDTTIRTDIRIGSEGINLPGKKVPSDTLRKLQIIKKDSIFIDPVSKSRTLLKNGDTIVCNVRYKKIDSDSIRRSCFYYKRDSLHVPGQYYCYAIMDSRTCKLLAYCSLDRLGSRLNSLLVNRNQNGSSLAKPLIYALAYDLGIYIPSQMASDDKEIPDTCKWTRKYSFSNGNPSGMIYLNANEKEGYRVHNHNMKFDGYDFLFNHLWNSNNILAVETMYRLDTDLTGNDSISINVINYLQRIGLNKLKKLDTITGPQLFCAMASLLNDHINVNKKQSQTYSIALGTLELSLYEQMHLFNVLYNNKLIVTPANNPSLFINEIRIAGKKVNIADSIKTRKIFSDISNILPVKLALHKRLTSNPADHLLTYDICNYDNTFLSNFAKSGTTDDIIKPFNSDINDKTRTNYGLWNATLRLLLKRNSLKELISRDSLLKNRNIELLLDSIPVEEELDVTLACIGECNIDFTGRRDGKSLHGYVSKNLLHSFGIRCKDGFYKTYEQNLISETSDKVKYAAQEESDLSFLSKAFIKLKTGIGTDFSIDKIKFEKSRFGTGIRLRGKYYRKMLKFATSLGEHSSRYCDLLDQLKNPESITTAKMVIDQIKSIEISNNILKRDLERACTSLLQSLDNFTEK